MRLALTALVLTLAGALVCRGGPAEVGSPAPAWTATDWIHSPPNTVENLRGNVVLVRWWTGPGCPFCTRSAQSLNQLDADFRDKGLTVIGMYHHKSQTPIRPDRVRELAEQLQFTFPIAIDREWKTLRTWWLDHHDVKFTSISVVIDRRGIVRRVVTNGEILRDGVAYSQLRTLIESLISESAPATRP